MAELKVGGEVDAFCTRCKMVLAHTILAVWAEQIKKVRCNTCMGEHSFRSAQPGSKPARPRSSGASGGSAPKPAAEKALASSYEALIAGKSRASARRYSPKEKFEVGELVEHPSFGLGVIAATRGIDKVDVAFPGTVKTLLHNRGAAPASFARPPQPRLPDVEAPEEASNGDPTAETSDEPEGDASGQG
jgi:hypothetical protein